MRAARRRGRGGGRGGRGGRGGGGGGGVGGFRAAGHKPAIFRRAASRSGGTGTTLRRDWVTRGNLAKRRSAFTWASVAGVLAGRRGARSTTGNLGCPAAVWPGCL